MKSIWYEGLKKPKFDSFSGNIQTDVLIIGGGMAGILCGYMLKNAGVDCVIAEAKEICSGVTGNTTAKLTVAHGAIFDKMIKRFGENYVKGYLESQTAALSHYKALCKNIDCDFKISDSYVYSQFDKEKIALEFAALKRLNIDVGYGKINSLPFSAVAVRLQNQAQFNPLKFAFSIARDLKIFENTEIKEITSCGAVCEGGIIKAKKIIVATHFPFINKHGAYFLKMYQHRSYVIALQNAADIKGMYVDADSRGLSMRSYKGLLLLGGGGHRTGKSGGNFNELRRFAREHYPNSREVAFWATEDCITLDDIPYIGRYCSSLPDLYVATGFNKWGMTSSMVAAHLLCDLITKGESKYEKIYSPDRSILRPQLAVNGFETAVDFIRPTVPRCSHMGCALIYNKAEHTWDCPCHGSRFSEDGTVLDNPATKNIKIN